MTAVAPFLGSVVADTGRVRDFSSSGFAEILAQCLAAVAPTSLPVWAQGPMLRVGNMGVCPWEDVDPPLVAKERLSETDVRELALAALLALQHEAVGFTHADWPSGKPHKPGQNLHQATVRLTGETVELWYGDESDPALQLGQSGLVKSKRTHE